MNHESHIPLYYQIYEQLREEILSGRLKPGDPLPSETQICNECGVSRMTARMALSQLVNEGLVVRKKGKGTFVAPPKATLREEPFFFFRYTDLMKSLGLAAKVRVIRQEIAKPPPEVREALRLEEEDLVVRIVRLRIADDQVMALETALLPYRFFPNLMELDLNDKSLFQALEENFTVFLAYAIDSVELSTAGPYEAAELGIREGKPIVLNTRIVFSAEDIPIAFIRTIHRGDCFKAVVRCNRKELETFK